MVPLDTPLAAATSRTPVPARPFSASTSRAASTTRRLRISVGCRVRSQRWRAFGPSCLPRRSPLSGGPSPSVSTAVTAAPPSLSFAFAPDRVSRYIGLPPGPGLRRCPRNAGLPGPREHLRIPLAGDHLIVRHELGRGGGDDTAGGDLHPPSGPAQRDVPGGLGPRRQWVVRADPVHLAAALLVHQTVRVGAGAAVVGVHHQFPAARLRVVPDLAL